MKAVNALAGLINNLVLFGMCAFRIIPAEIFFGGGNLTYQVKDAILSLSELKITFEGAKPYFDKIIYQEKNDKKKEPLPPVKEKIEIKNLGFSYPGHVVFEHLNMDFKIGGNMPLSEKVEVGKQRFSDYYWDNYRQIKVQFYLIRWMRLFMTRKHSVIRWHTLNKMYFFFTQQSGKT